MYGNTKDPQIAKATLRKKNGARGIRLPDFRLYYKASNIKVVWYGQKKKKKRNMNQWKVITNTEINTRTYGQVMSDK